LFVVDLVDLRLKNNCFGVGLSLTRLGEQPFAPTDTGHLDFSVAPLLCVSLTAVFRFKVFSAPLRLALPFSALKTMPCFVFLLPLLRGTYGPHSTLSPRLGWLFDFTLPVWYCL